MTFKPGDLVAAPDRWGYTRTGLYSGNVVTYTTRHTATGDEIPRKVPLVTVTVIDRPPGIEDGKCSSGFAVDVRKVRAATAAEGRSDIRPLLDTPSPGNWADWTQEMREAECERWCALPWTD